MDCANVVEGPPELLKVRQSILDFSMGRAKARLDARRRDAHNPQQNPSQYALTASHEGDSLRSLSACSISPDGTLLVTGSWSSQCRVWSITTGEPISTFDLHTERISDVAFHPKTGQIASACAGGKLHLWHSHFKPLELKGHVSRISRVRFHPVGDFLLSTSFDCTWKLWDLNTGVDVAVMKGHAKPVFGLDVHPDGSLVMVGDADGICRVWDLRSGKCILDFVGHAKEVVACAFARNGYMACSASMDNSAKLWDLRKKDELYTIAGHLKPLSDAHFLHDGKTLVTSSFDHTVKLWDVKDFSLHQTLIAHKEKVMRIATLDKAIISVSYDRTWKLWTRTDNL